MSAKEKKVKTAVEYSDYLNVTYSDSRAPRTEYPSLLGQHLLKQYYKETGTILDLGCGRGEFLDVFSDLGFKSCGVDISPNVEEFSKSHTVKIVDIEREEFPFEEGTFDFVFSKSVIEHMRNPMPALMGAHKALKTGGTAVFMTPSWKHNYKEAFYVDYTHVTPFTRLSLKDAMTIAGFKDVKVTYFYQLPFLWKRPYLKFISKLISALPIPYNPIHEVPWGVSNKINKLIRFSKEPMLLATAKKEDNDT